MKRTQLLIPAVVLLLLLASTATPALAVKEKPGKIEYTLPGNIVDRNTGMYGTISLTFSGGIKGTPDSVDTSYSEGPVDLRGDEKYEYYWFDERTGVEWMAEVHYVYHVSGWQRYSSYTARWYSPQPTCNGKLVAIWNDGSTTTFSVGLCPLWIEQFAEDGSGVIDGSFTLEQVLYCRENKTQDWVYNRTETQSDSYSGSGSFAGSMRSIQFAGKIQSKGRPPLQGALSLWDSKSIYDAWTQSVVSVSGTIGPYDINIYVTGR